MDSIEELIKQAFSKIPFGDGEESILDKEVVFSLILAGEDVTINLVIDKQNESFIDSTSSQVEKALKDIKGINSVQIKVFSSLAEAEAEDQKHNQAPQAPACGMPAGGPGQGHHGHGHGHGPQGQAGPPEQTNYLQDYKNVILIASGKGGVGKSTVSVNLAMALKAIGKSVSMLDADIYGPSLPVMMGSRNEFPKVSGQQIMPISRYGVEFMSIGNLVKEDESLIWRGPMVHQAVEQMLRDTAWPGGDYMIIDLPPGTGDVQLTLAQMTSADGTLIVCTPQDVALLDARRAISMFEKVNIEVLGIIENMSTFVCPNCGEETHIFSSGGVIQESKDQQIEMIGQIPIELDIRLGGDSGEPIVHKLPQSKTAEIFKQMAQKLDDLLNKES